MGGIGGVCLTDVEFGRIVQMCHPGPQRRGVRPANHFLRHLEERTWDDYPRRCSMDQGRMEETWLQINRYKPPVSLRGCSIAEEHGSCRCYAGRRKQRTKIRPLVGYSGGYELVRRRRVRHAFTLPVNQLYTVPRQWADSYK